MSEQIKRTALAAHEKINVGATPEELAKILTWTREVVSGLGEFNEALSPVQDLQQRSATELMQAYEPKTDIRSRIKGLFGTPQMTAEQAELVLQTLPGHDVKPYVLDALLKSGSKKHLTLLLSRATIQEKFVRKPQLPYGNCHSKRRRSCNW